jgi:4-hydroxy-tetrahydrodipicolinate reductase
MNLRPLRVVQWATGNVGLRSLRAIIEHPDLELVGVFVHSAAKVGKDAGDLCGIGPVGIRATDDADAIIALHADCVMYMPFDCDFDQMAAILRSGTNIVTTKGDFQNPACIDPDLREQIEQACSEGQSSIYSAGSSPGFITDALPLVLAALQRRLDCITVDEYSDVSSRNSPDIIYGAMGFGRAPSEDAAGHIAQSMWRSRRRSFELLADAFGLPIDSVEATAEIATANKRVQIAAGVIEAGTVAGTRITISGMRGGRPLFRFRANWYCTTDLDVDWDLIHSGWRVVVDGDTPLNVLITFPVALEDYPAMAPGLTAHPAVNAVRAVCAAEPGIRTSLDIPTVIPVFGRGTRFYQPELG